MTGETSVGRIPGDRLDTPAVGLIVRIEDDSNQVAGAVLRALEANHHVIVGAIPGVESEAVDFAEQLGATVVELPEASEERARNDVVSVAREAGFPGLLYQQNLMMIPDYDRAASELSERDRYWEPLTRDSAATGSVIIGTPAYNEEVGIGSVVIAAQDYADEVVVVDDGSTDETAEIARSAGATVIKHDHNRGKGAAVETLFEYSRRAEPDALVLLDGDGQHRPADVPDAVAPVLSGEADLVVGSRYLDGRNSGETPFYRRFGQRILDLATFATSGERVSDSQSGFRILSQEAVETLDINATAFGVESAMIDSAAAAGLTIEEVPVDVRYEGVPGRQTQNPLRHGLTVLTFVLQLVRDRHPLVFFGLPGLVMMLAGGLYGINAILIYQTTGQFFPAKVLVSGFLTMFGMIGLFTGLILNRMANIIAIERADD